jgi:hypothetical protein
MPKLDIRMTVDGPMEFYPNLIVADIHEAMKDKPWYKSLTAFEVGKTDYIGHASSIAAEIYQEASAARGQVNVEKVMEEKRLLERQVRERTDAYFSLLAKYERLEKEAKGGM